MIGGLSGELKSGGVKIGSGGSSNSNGKYNEPYYVMVYDVYSNVNVYYAFIVSWC